MKYKHCPDCEKTLTQKERWLRKCYTCGGKWESEDNDDFGDEDDELAGETDLEGKMDILLDRAFHEGGDGG